MVKAFGSIVRTLGALLSLGVMGCSRDSSDEIAALRQEVDALRTEVRELAAKHPVCPGSAGRKPMASAGSAADRAEAARQRHEAVKAKYRKLREERRLEREQRRIEKPLESTERKVNHRKKENKDGAPRQAWLNS